MTSNPQNSKQWDLGRFVKTLSYFGAIPFLSSVNWFQQWFGNRPDPTVDSQKITSVAASAIPADPIAPKDTGLVLVLGAAGRVGEQVVRRLEERGYSVQAVMHSDPSQVTALIQPATAVIYCADTAEWDKAQTLTAWLQAFAPSDAAYQPIFDFAHPPEQVQEIWGALDDVVMGGVSESGVQLGDGVANFSGVVSTANSGGFASIRTRNFEPPLNLANYDGVELRVKGDGKRYKFMLRTETRWDGIAYCFSFDTIADQWITVRVPFSALVPVFRAKTVSDQPLNPAHVTALQLMLSKFEYDGALNPRFEAGFFQLQIGSIRAYQMGADSKFVFVQPLDAPDSPALLELVQQSGIPYTIIRPTQLTQEPGGEALRVGRMITGQVSTGQVSTGQVSTVDVASLCVAALEHSEARNLSFAVTTEIVTAENNGCTIGDWACLFQSIERPNV